MTVDHVYVIAEAGVNHNGSVDRARALVDAAADAGADTVKFQTFDPAALVTKSAKQAEYQIANQGDVGSQLAMLQELRLSDAAHHELRDHAVARGIEFLSSPFDLGSLDFLANDLGVHRIKLGSGEITNGPTLFRVGQTGLPLILSTGMATLEEIDEALGALAHGYVLDREPANRQELSGLWRDDHIHRVLAEKVVLLHCTTQYPCPPEHCNLRAMGTLADAFGIPTGYSDHTMGIEVPVAAVALGAVMIEKHVTIDRSLPGPDHVASVEPAEFARMVAAIRSVGEAMGSPEKRLLPIERDNARAGRRSIVAAEAIPAGATFDPTNLTVKRPGNGRSPMDWWDVVGTSADRTLAPDDLL